MSNRGSNQGGFSLVELLVILAVVLVIGYFLVGGMEIKKVRHLTEALKMGSAAAENNDFSNLAERLEEKTFKKWDVKRNANGEWEISLTLSDESSLCEALASKLWEKSDAGLPYYTQINGETLVKDSEKTLCRGKAATFVWIGETKATPGT